MAATCGGSFSNWTSPSCADGHRMTGAGAALFTTLISTLLDEQCKIGDPSIYPADTATPLSEYDFIVVGAGTAGSVVASRLSEVSEWKVLLLEAGGDPPPVSDVPKLFSSMLGTEIDWNYSTQPEQGNCRAFANQRCAWHQGKVLGGTSVINGMMYLRGSRNDYAKWVEEGNTDWSYENVLPYFKKSEDLRSPVILARSDSKVYHSTGGELTVAPFNSEEPLIDSLLKSAKELKYSILTDFCAEDTIGFGLTLGMLRDGTRCSASKAFLSPAKDRKNLHVVKHAQVTKIIINTTTNTTTGVTFRKNGKLTDVKTIKEVIVSAGTINSPQLLMLSGIGPEKHLKSLGIPVIKNSAVGENMQDHLKFSGAVHSVDRSRPCDTSCLESKLDPAYRYLTRRSGPLSYANIAPAAGFINTKNTLNPVRRGEYPDIQMQHSAFQCNDTSAMDTFTGFYGLSQEAKDSYRKLITESYLLIQVPILLNPKSRGNITLKSADPLVYPLINSGYLSDPADVETLVSAVEYVVRSGNTDALQEHEAVLRQVKLKACDGLRFNTRDYWRCMVRQLTTSMYHVVGTCKMGPSTDRKAVVDQTLKVHGVSGLRVADGSVMPTIVSGNPMAAIVMIGERIADFIKKEWGQV